MTSVIRCFIFDTVILNVGNLFIIDGASGTGKTDLVRYVRDKIGRGYPVYIVPKYTTRSQRPEEIRTGVPLDLLFDSESEFDEKTTESGFIHYEYRDKRYGFFKYELDEAIRDYENVFIIVGNKDTIQLLKDLYTTVRLTTIFIDTDPDKIIERLKSEGYTNEEIDFRRKRLLDFDYYIDNSDFYDFPIVNDSDKISYHKAIDEILDKLNPIRDTKIIISGEEFSLIKPLIGHKKDIESKLRRYTYEKNVFLMMKFRGKNEKLYGYIKEIIEKKGYNCIRADENEWDITGNVYNPIAVLYCCKYGIALFDEPEEGNNYSPNVTYELGMMQLQRKVCLILRNSTLPGVPFDLTKDLHEKYADNLDIGPIIDNWIDKIELMEY